MSIIRMTHYVYEGYGNIKNETDRSEFFVMGLKIWQEELLFLVQQVQEKQHWGKMVADNQQIWKGKENEIL